MLVCERALWFLTVVTTEALRSYGARRVYETSLNTDGSAALRLRDRMVDLGPNELAGYRKLIEWLPTHLDATSLEAELRGTGIAGERLAHFARQLAEAGLLIHAASYPQS